MDIHEYQAKQLLAKAGVPIPDGGIAHSADEAAYLQHEISGRRWVVKAQIHSGARGKAGGVRICESDREVREAASELLGKRLVTSQTGPQGKVCKAVYVESASEIERELYVAMVLDRESEQVVVVASTEGGMEIEDIARDKPEAIVRQTVDPAIGLLDFQARELAFALGLPASQIADAVRTFRGCYRLIRDRDANLVEINPLVAVTDGRLLALDAKVAFDDNALFRQSQIAELRDRGQEDPRETAAQDQGLSYVGLEGDIGCMINGAGLAMATMDMIKHAGGEPANFLDIGGGASPERVANAFRLVLSDDNVRAMLVNIYAGINRCDWVAEGIVQALGEIELNVPLVVRLSGTNVEQGKEILNNSGQPIITADTLAEAAERVVAARAAA
ncbi:MAG: malate--CoA ligase subunit beta [Halofilum sp. (in: g-proteobacteria)]|nr:malate--CoA ligase subunit beta [Halofilum sp. (in: g-proteobacteria)]